jgi:hypothetical protein
MKYLTHMKTIPQTEAGPLAKPPFHETSWLAIAAMLADLAFETDCEGCFTAFAPGKVLGYPANRLLGTQAASLLFPALKSRTTEDATASFKAIIATICAECIGWQGKVRLTPAIGNPGLYRLALAPRITANGVMAGTYGLLFDLEANEEEDAAAAALPQPAGSPMLDFETGLWTAKSFADEAARRFDRLDVEEMPGTLIFLGFGRAEASLHSAIAMRLAEELRETVRPTDLLGRMDATTFALWCDGMDHLTGGERAARFCKLLPGLLPGSAIITAGLAPRWPGSADDPLTVIQHAQTALRLADLATARQAETPLYGQWRVWKEG